MTRLYTSDRSADFVARPTLPQVLGMIGGARRRILIASFSDIDQRVIEAVCEASERGVEEILVVLDRSNCNLARAKRGFPESTRILVNIEPDRRSDMIMHIKSVVADRSVLIGSSNLSSVALESNLELSVLVNDDDLALEVVQFVESCVTRGLLVEH
mgnify:FL=1